MKQRKVYLECLQCGEVNNIKKLKDFIECPECRYREKIKELPINIENKIEIHVGKEDIEIASRIREAGIKNKIANWCPVAQSLLRNGFEEVAVGEYVLNASGASFPTPSNVKQAISFFDRGEDLEPFTFYLEDVWNSTPQ